MAFKLSKQEVTRYDEILKDLRETLEKLTAAIDDPASTSGQKSETASLFSINLNDAEEFRDEIASRLREEFDAKSENWQESDKGCEAVELVEEWENADFSEEIEILEPSTDGLQDHIDNFENLPTDV